MIEVKDEQSMVALGERIGRLLCGGEIIELVRDVGAGKTTFVRGLARGMGVDETVQSPSFTISRQYDARDGLCLAHYDFYRLDDPGIMANELAEVLAQGKNVTVIEWSDTVRSVLPDDKLTMTISALSEVVRHVQLSHGGDKSKKLEEQIR